MILRSCCAMFMLAVVAITSRSVAEEPKFEEASPIGRPNGFKSGASTRFVIWHDAGTWHVRTTTGSKDTHVFSGTIRIVGGKMTSVKPIAAEKGGKSKTNLDYGSWNAEGTLFTFSFTTGRDQDGFDMQLSDKATALKFDLKLDGKESPDKVHLGAKNAHPKSATFYLHAQPGK
ncbi:MAG: hypothetical protein EXS09_02875 [Gemmataceae bacterium]|nr:hypothetical protein [Gemmataceae bacterium]